MSDRNDGVPELVDPIDLPERAFTARNLADYHQCPQKFLLSWFVPREETRGFLGGPASLHQAVRQALVECLRLGGPRKVDPARVGEVFEDAWDGSACADSLEEERLRSQGLKMLREFCAGWVADSTETLEVDLRMDVELGDHRFIAVADAVMREADGGVNAVRWLSTRKPPSVNDICDSTGWGIFYACALEHFPDEDVSVTMYSLRRCSGHRIRFGEDELEKLVRRATRVADRIRVATEFPCVTGMHCRWCRARSRCPALG